MSRLASFVGIPLRVLQPSIWKKQYELRSEDQLIGTLRFPRIFRQEAVGECEEGRWILRERGLFKRTIHVRLPEKGKPIASLELAHFSLTNKLKLPQYRMLRLTRNFLKTAYRLTTSMNAEVCSLELKLMPKHTGTVVIDQKGEEYEELPWLVFLVWFISIIDQNRKHS